MVRAVLAALLIAALNVSPASAQDHGRAGRDALLAELGRDHVAFHDETGGLRFVAGSRRSPAASRNRLGRPANARAAAAAFAARYGELFGVADGRDLRVEREIHAPGQSTFVRFRQYQGNVPVIGGEVTIQADPAGNVTSAIGEASPARLPSLQPAINASTARQQAVAAVGRSHDLAPAALAVTEPELSIYDPALLGAPALPAAVDRFGARLVWRTEVRNGDGSVNEFVLVDATSGAIALRFSQLAHALNRRVCDAAGGSGSGGRYPCTTGGAMLTEATPDPSTVAPAPHQDAINAFNFSRDFYQFFEHRFGRDSIDGNGHALVTTVRYCPFGGCSSPNAFWNGEQAVFWPGMATDDIVAHEFSHGFTQHTSGLFYYHQSGAINEALSDIFGELVDLTNDSVDSPEPAEHRWLIGEGSPIFDLSPTGAIRSMKNPAAFGQPDRMQSPNYWAQPDDGHGVHTNSGVANKAAYLMVDGETFNGQAVTGIGIDKAAAVWYRAAIGYLGSGSDYADLGLALNQACADLVGSAVKDGTGADSGTIATADCDEVARAVVATEMALPPTVPGASKPIAPLCTSGTPVDVFFDQIAAGHPGWTPNNSRWTYSTDYPASAPGSLWGQTPAVAGAGNIQRTAAVTLPANAYLRFEHAHVFDYDFFGSYYDGGIVEYKVGTNAWKDARPLFTHNGYNGTIRSYSGGGNPLASRQAFVGYSAGHFSSRIDLSSLAGKSVRFRFRAATDSASSDYGWFVDDVRLFRCVGGGDTTPPSVAAPNTNIRSGVAVGTGSTPVKVNVSFTATDESGISKTQLQRRANEASWSNVSLASATATSKNVKLAISTTTTRQFRARATDTKANTGDWTTANSYRVLAFQDGAPGDAQPGSWTSAANSSFFGGSVRHSSTAGASQSRTGLVSDFAIVSTRGPGRGRAEVWIDGSLATTVDLYASSVSYRQVVFAVDFGAPAMHTIELRVTGTKNPNSKGTRVDLDAFLALGP